MKYVFDTDHLSILQKESGNDLLNLQARLAMHNEEDFAVTIVSFHEQAIGCHTFINVAKKSEKVLEGYDRFSRLLECYSNIPVLTFDSRANAVFSKLKKRNLRVSTMDLRIASIAISQDLLLLTRNVKDFAKITDLSTENWLI